jgi:hypothetical protein
MKTKSKRGSLQRDASVAMLRMVTSIKVGTSAQVQDDGKTLVIYNDANSITFSHVVDANTNALTYQIGANQPVTLVDGKVQGLQFNVQGDKVTVDLDLKEDDAEAHFVSTAMMRNYGG